jgi:uncharacterized Tic20 family protein
MQQDPNYGSYQEPRLHRVPVEMSPQEERTWSMLAHLSVLVWPITAFLPIAPLIIWLVYKNKSQKVAFHAAQALWYQIAWIVGWVVGSLILGIVGFVLTLITFGLALIVLIPLVFLIGLGLFLVPFIHECYAAYKVNQDIDYRYPVIADMVDGGGRKLT